MKIEKTLKGSISKTDENGDIESTLICKQVDDIVISNMHVTGLKKYIDNTDVCGMNITIENSHISEAWYYNFIKKNKAFSPIKYDKSIIVSNIYEITSVVEGSNDAWNLSLIDTTIERTRKDDSSKTEYISTDKFGKLICYDAYTICQRNGLTWLLPVIIPNE